MFIKNIFNVNNFKGLSNNYRVDFEDITYLVGDNAKNKTTIGSLPVWILTGCNLYASNKESVSNEEISDTQDTIASMTIIDNDGNEHVITRSKGKNNFVLLDGIRVTQEILTRFYKEVHAFVCSYNPSYFRNLSLAKQREFLLKFLPSVSMEDVKKLLEDDEKEILTEPIVDVNSFCKNKRSENSMLEAELNRVMGNKEIYIKQALEKEENTLIFSKDSELENLEKEYENMIANGEDILDIDDLENKIKRLNTRISDNINIHLKNLKKAQEDEMKKLDSICQTTTSKCPSCHQEITNENVIKSLEINYKNNINTYAKKIDDLKLETQNLMVEKKIQTDKYNNMKNPEIQQKAKIREQIKIKIDTLRKEKNDIEIHNKSVENVHNTIVNAKQQIDIINGAIEEIKNQIELNNKKIEVANRLNILMIQEQMKKVSKYLNKVTIEFSKVNTKTGEIEDAYVVKYNGKEYEKLSKSYKVRADIEIALLINKICDIKTPMFIDDVESITEIKFDSNIQTIVAKVIKYNELEILYSYKDLLLREKQSINRIIEESSELIQIAA